MLVGPHAGHARETADACRTPTCHFWAAAAHGDTFQDLNIRKKAQCLKVAAIAEEYKEFDIMEAGVVHFLAVGITSGAADGSCGLCKRTRRGLPPRSAGASRQPTRHAGPQQSRIAGPCTNPPSPARGRKTQPPRRGARPSFGLSSWRHTSRQGSAATWQEPWHEWILRTAPSGTEHGLCCA